MKHLFIQGYFLLSLIQMYNSLINSLALIFLVIDNKDREAKLR